MGAPGIGGDDRPVCFVARSGNLDRPARFQVDAARPGGLDEGLCRDQLACLSVDYIEEAVLGRVEQGLHLLPVNLQIGEHDVHVRVVVPGLSWSGLIVPKVLPGVRVQRDDRAKEQVVPSLRAPDLAVPGRAVARPDVEHIKLRIIGEAVPGITSSPMLPPFPCPGPGSHLHRFVLKAVRWVAGHDKEFPGLLPGLGVIGGYPAARGSFLGAPVADEDLSGKGLGSPRDI